jgi:cell division protein FtsZ
MSLMEVNEASLLIQEAAHEDANIIFGAVVDDKLDGRVKVTVIATGFDGIVSRPPVAPENHTPVDLQQYTAQFKDKIETPAQPSLEMARMSIARRPTLDLAAVMPAAAPTPVPADAPGEAGDIDLEALSAFDVPAFLRREG